MVCWVCDRNRGGRLANFGREATIDGWLEVVLPMGAIYRHIPAKYRIPDPGLHGVLRVTICGNSGMRDALSAATGNSAAVIVRNFFQPILGVDCMVAQTVTKGRMAKGNDNANAKGNVSLECRGYASHVFLPSNSLTGRHDGLVPNRKHHSPYLRRRQVKMGQK